MIARRAAKILCNHTGCQAHEVDWRESHVLEALSFVLQRCSGLPLELSLAVGAIVDLTGAAEDPAEDLVEAWTSYEEETEKFYDSYHALINADTNYHTGRAATLVASLNRANKRREVMIGAIWPTYEMLRALCVLEKPALAVFAMLQPLQGVESDWKTTKIAREFERVNLVRTETRSPLLYEVLGVSIHNLVHNFRMMQAKTRSKVKKCHKRSIKGYEELIKTEGRKGLYENGALGRVLYGNAFRQILNMADIYIQI